MHCLQQCKCSCYPILALFIILKLFFQAFVICSTLMDKQVLSCPTTVCLCLPLSSTFFYSIDNYASFDFSSKSVMTSAQFSHWMSFIKSWTSVHFCNCMRVMILSFFSWGFSFNSFLGSLWASLFMFSLSISSPLFCLFLLKVLPQHPHGQSM